MGARRSRNSLRYCQTPSASSVGKGDIVYPAAALGVVYDPSAHRQRFLRNVPGNVGPTDTSSSPSLENASSVTPRWWPVSTATVRIVMTLKMTIDARLPLSPMATNSPLGVTASDRMSSVRLG